MPKIVSVIVKKYNLRERYRFDHARKGKFTATVLEVDDTYVRVLIDTSPGSGQEYLANTFLRDKDGKKVTPPTTEKLLKHEFIRAAKYLEPVKKEEN